MSCCSIFRDSHVLYNLFHETEKLATNLNFLNSSHKRPELQSDLKHLVQNQTHYETDLNGDMKSGRAFTPKASHECNLPTVSQKVT